MAEVVFVDGTILFNAVDLSDRVVSANLNTGVETPDNTSMGNSTRTVAAGGLETRSLSLTLLQDFAASKTDATVWGALNGGTAVAVNYKATSAATSATNPDYQGSYVVSSYTPIQGSVGDLMVANVDLQPTNDITRAVV